MKKLLALAVSTVLVVPLFAQETEPLAPAVQQEEEARPPESAWWPAPFAICEWPETPDMVGLRLTIPFSTKQENVTGLEVGFWGRCKDFQGVAVSILRNDVKDTLSGFQVGLYNTADSIDLFGIQVGLWNETQSFRGVQCGLVNLTGDGSGFQVGLINRAETLSGYQVGLINLIRDAEIPMFPLVNIGF